MPKEKEGFFDDEEIDEEGGEKPETPENKPTTPKKQTPPPQTEDPTPEVDKIDWKAKYEAAEAEKLDRRYLDELLILDDTLEGEALADIEGGERYRELRSHGLSARAAYAALMEEIAEASPDKTPNPASAKNHVSATRFRSTASPSRMDKSTRAIADDLLPDLSDEDKEALYRRVSGK